MKKHKGLAGVALPSFAAGAMVIGFGACGGSAPQQEPKAEQIAECAAYYAQLRSCFGDDAPVVPAAISYATAALKKRSVDREQIRAACSRDHARLARACR